ncbi:MAG: hypothetical protein LIO94_02415, partial [Clostridiales bacterium]|nr:hypothetical protein [Clostridiales bacterium]
VIKTSRFCIKQVKFSEILVKSIDFVSSDVILALSFGIREAPGNLHDEIPHVKGIRLLNGRAGHP